MSERLREGSLCTGYNGLGLAAEAVVGCELAWYSEIEPAPAALLAQRYPDVPNIGDLTTQDWSQLEPIDVLTAGYPCQPFSNAGHRRGTDDERHLWPYIAEAIRVLRPQLVLLENVRGHLSLGLDSVLADLAALGYDAEYGLLRASSIGACHSRARVFIAAVADDVDRPAGAAAATLVDGEWEALQQTLFDAAPPVRLTTAGSVRRSGVLSHAPDLVTHHVSEPLLPTPSAFESDPTDEFVDEMRDNFDPQARMYLPGRKWHSQRTLSRVAPLLPTPEASDASGGRRSSEFGGTRESGAKRAVTLATAIDHKTSLLPTPTSSAGAGGQTSRGGDRADEPLLGGIVKLLPTPAAADGERGPDFARNGRGPDGGREASGGDDLVTTMARLLPTPTARDHKDGANTTWHPEKVKLPHTIGALLPTPTTTGDGAQGPADPDEWEQWKADRAERGIATGQGQLGTAVRNHLLPTPNASDFRGSTSPDSAKDWEQRGVNLPERIQRQRDGVSIDWGDYELAVRRHEQLVDRPAPPPVDAKGRLAAPFVEWMMALPEGWVTEVDLAALLGRSKDPRQLHLKMLGNGVVPPQAAVAIDMLLGRLGL